jgi:hypothetical protein
MAAEGMAGLRKAVRSAARLGVRLGAGDRMARRKVRLRLLGQRGAVTK